jgi:hypothetical protein
MLEAMAAMKRHEPVRGRGQRVLVLFAHPYHQHGDQRQPEQQEQVRPHDAPADLVGGTQEMVVIGSNGSPPS